MVVKNRDDAIRHQYFLWLCDITDTNNSKEDKSNFELLWWLHNKEFYWHTPNDDNRVEDGKSLRQGFADQNLEKDCPCLDGPCTMLEMLVALAIRMDFVLSNGPDDYLVPKCFWEMIDNLKLNPFTEKDPDFKKKLEDNENKLNILLERKYSSSGEGGLFPLKKPIRNQQRVEIWYQMQTYLDEKRRY